MLVPIASQITKEIQVIPGRLTASPMQRSALMIGNTGTKGTRKEPFNSGNFLRNTMIAIEISVNAANVPMFTR